MRSAWSTLLLQTINFLALVWLLRRFLFRPVMALLARRRAEAETARAQLSAAAAAREEARKAATEDRARIAEEREQALAEARVRVEQERGELLSQARGEQAALVEAGRRKLDEERALALAELRSRAVALGGEIAERLLREVAPTVGAHAFLDRLAAQLSALGRAELDALRADLAGGAPVQVAVAPALDDEAARRFSDRLREILGSTTRVEFVEDDALIAGAELRFPRATLRYSVRDGILEAQGALDGHAHAP